MGSYLITGATRGIGRALVDELASEELILAARDADALAALCAALPLARAMPVDLARPELIAAAVREAGLPERLDGIVHSAGIIRLGQVAELAPETWHEVFTVNVTSAAELTRVALPALRAARGTAVFVNSGAGRAVGRAGNGVYAASKHALVALAEALRLEEPDVRVTSLYSGRAATDMQRELRAYEGEEYRPADYLRPAVVAKIIADALRLPPDTTIGDLRVLPRG
jgi:NADP-dependent 3-hydroxy acid dehydrogenase YdfG